MNWRDLHVALLLGRHGNLTAVGRTLGMDATTVRRRVLNLEQRLRMPLFVREGRRWVMTEQGREVLTHLEAMAAGARQIKHLTMGDTIQGRVRLTTVDAVANWVLLPALEELRQRHPALTLEIRCTEQALELRRSQVDVAVRLFESTQRGLKVKKLMEIELGLFASKAYATRHKLTKKNLQTHQVDLLLYGPKSIPESQRTLQAAPMGHTACITASMNVLWDMVARGFGLGVLPVRQAEQEEGLVRLDTWQGEALLTRGMWRAAPEELCDTPKLRAVLDWLDEAAAKSLLGR